MKVRKGEIYYYNFGSSNGSVQCGLRPVLVIQNNDLNRTSTTTVIAAITTSIKKSYLKSHVYIGENFGMKKPSMVILEQMRTISKTDLGEYIGFIDDYRVMKKINEGIKAMYSLWNYPSQGKVCVKVLCSNCMKRKLKDDDFLVRRLIPNQKVKYACSECNTGKGYEYVIVSKECIKRIHRGL